MEVVERLDGRDRGGHDVAREKQGGSDDRERGRELTRGGVDAPPVWETAADMRVRPRDGEHEQPDRGEVDDRRVGRVQKRETQDIEAGGAPVAVKQRSGVDPAEVAWSGVGGEHGRAWGLRIPAGRSISGGRRRGIPGARIDGVILGHGSPRNCTPSRSPRPDHSYRVSGSGVRERWVSCGTDRGMMGPRMGMREIRTHSTGMRPVVEQ